MIKHIDTFLNNITMYRLMLYGLFLEAVYAMTLAALHRIDYSIVQMLLSIFILIFVSFGTNVLFSKLTRAIINAESMFITALLLFFILDPSVTSLRDAGVLALAAVLAQASKYVFAIGQKHVLNPVAASAFLLDVFGFSVVTWWVATPWMFPVALIFGLMVVRKIRRFEEVGAFVLVATTVALLRGISFQSFFLSWPVVFFATLMLTEPRTAPALKREQILFGAGVGGLFSSGFVIGQIASTPEFALIVGNVFAYVVSSRDVLLLTFKSMTCETEQICDFVFTPNKPLHFKPGQYLEWTLPLHKTDDRGNRRYFSIASAPSDTEIHLGMRVDRAHASSFKQQLLVLKPGDTIVASHLAGEFILPNDERQKLVFIAGGIGITPFRSMLRYLANTKQKRNIILFYCANTPQDFAYKKEFDELCDQVGMCSICVVQKPSEGWTGESGFITKEVIEKDVPDYRDRMFYFSGPPMMVENYVKLVRSMGVPRGKIKTDYFPGF